jgi:hypothetical protein
MGETNSQISVCTKSIILHVYNICGYYIYTYMYTHTDVPLYPWVIHSKTYHDYMKLQIILNAIHNVIFV